MFHYSIEIKKPDAQDFGIKNLEICDGFYGKDLAEMTGSEIEDARNALIRQRSRIVLYTVYIPVADTEAYVKFFRAAHLLNVENVKLDLSAIGKEENLSLLAPIIDMARGMHMRLLFEMDDAYRFFTLDTYRALHAESTGLIFNSLALLKRGYMPYRNILSKSSGKVKDAIRFIRIMDGIRETGEPTPPEEGNGEIKEVISVLWARSFDGYLSITDYNGDMADTLRHLEKLLMEI